MNREDVYSIIDNEREYQIKKWGSIKDKPHEVGAWITLMQHHLDIASKNWCENNNDISSLEEIKKVISIGVACGEQHGLKYRWNNRVIE